jgi:hypothetical protein
MSGTNEIQEATTKGVESAVKFCVNCGAEFNEALTASASDKIKCPACLTIFAVMISS